MIVQSELPMAWRFFVIKPFPHSVLVISVSVQNLNSNNKPLIENYSVKISHCNKMWPYLGLISVFYNDNSDVYCHIVVGIFPIFVYLFTQTSFNYHFFKNAFGFCIAVFIEMVPLLWNDESLFKFVTTFKRTNLFCWLLTKRNGTKSKQIRRNFTNWILKNRNRKQKKKYSSS